MKTEQILSQIPCTEQGLLDFVRYANRAVKENERQIKRLTEMIGQCTRELTMKGIKLEE